MLVLARDGRSTLAALQSQFCGKEKWDQEIKKAEEVIFKRTWKGQSNYKLESFVAQHRNARSGRSRPASVVPTDWPPSSL